MSHSILSLIHSGTKLWLDSVDPKLTVSSKEIGITGATSNPIIIADLIRTGRFDDEIKAFSKKGLSPEETTWEMTNRLVSDAEKVFMPVFEKSKGNNGYVSFEVDPLLEAHDCTLSTAQRADEYVRLAKKWSHGHPNRMIKVPATPAGLASLERIAAEGIPLNVTLIFSKRQYELARDAVWRGARTLSDLSKFKSVYSIFVSRIDVYTETNYSNLSSQSQGLAGILNAKLLWKENQTFWKALSTKTPLTQEIIFASTGTKKPTDKPWKYVEELAGSDIQTNPPATNDAVAVSDMTFTSRLSTLPNPGIVDELLTKIDWDQLEIDLMAEGLSKFADPHKKLIQLVSEKIRKTY